MSHFKLIYKIVLYLYSKTDSLIHAKLIEVFFFQKKRGIRLEKYINLYETMTKLNFIV